MQNLPTTAHGPPTRFLFEYHALRQRSAPFLLGLEAAGGSTGAGGGWVDRFLRLVSDGQLAARIGQPVGGITTISGSTTVVEASLARLRELALAIPRPGCDWEERPQFDPPASPEEVALFERAAGFSLPADLRAFLAATGAVVGLSVHNGYWLGGIEQLARSIASGDFPRSVSGEPAAPVATDGGGNVFLLSSSGHVWRWDHETGSVSEVAASFAGFVERVAADWAAYVADTPGWRFLA